jgi:hypothetical protein
MSPGFTPSEARTFLVRPASCEMKPGLFLFQFATPSKTCNFVAKFKTDPLCFQE